SQEPFSASTSTLDRPRLSATRPARTGLLPGTVPTRANFQPALDRRATTTSRPEKNATRGDPSGAAASIASPFVGATTSALARPGRARSAIAAAKPIHADLTEHRLACIGLRA